MALSKVLQSFQPLVRRQEITAWVEFPARPGRFADFPTNLQAQLQQALVARKIRRLYSHQEESFRKIEAGHHVVVVTPTASGKTLCYNLPILNRMLADPATRAVYLFPTKALAQDQMAELQRLVSAAGLNIGVHTYDGDTPADVRRTVRNSAGIVLTNPDMLHSGILPHHPKWAGFFRNLRFVVVDELHTYRGVFGSHVANVFRRLKRIAAFYGSHLQFICASATIANPAELAGTLLEEPIELIDGNGAPSAGKSVLFYNPPITEPELGLRKSALSSARRLAARFLREGVQTLVFASSRVNVEVLLRYLQEAIPRGPGQLPVVRGYRGGYLPSTRREIEAQLRRGELLGVVATNALELGIDIGTLQACVLTGYPGTVAATWQQIGRSGRRSGHSAAVLVARNLPLDQFMVRHPDYFFGDSPEHARIHPDNLQLLVSHIKCAAFELPFRKNERFGRESLEEILEFLCERGVLCRAGESYLWSEEGYPADSVSLRNISEENFLVLDIERPQRAIAEVDFESAPELIHDQAIYLCEGRQYQVEHLDYPNRKAFVREVRVDYFTEAITYSGLRILSVQQSQDFRAGRIEHGEVHLFKRVPGFKKIRFYSNENLGYGKIELPTHEFHTTSFWLTFDEKQLSRLPHSRSVLIQGLLGISYAFHHLAALLLMCDPRDLGRNVGDCYARWFANTGWEGTALLAPGQEDPTFSIEHFEDFEPTLFIYDNYPGGIGLAEQLYSLSDELISKGLELIQGCNCSRGCPSCVGPFEAVSQDIRSVSLDILRLGSS